MNIVFVGAGAVGGYFGGKMVKAGVPVRFLVRDRRYRQLSEQGLRIRSVHGDFTVRPLLAASPEEIEGPEAVLVAVKAYQLEGTLPALDTWVAQGSKVIPLLNGIEAVDRLAERYGSGAVLGGLSYVESTLDEDGQIVQTSPMQELVFGPLSQENADFAERLLQTLEPCGFKATLSDNIRRDMWEKYMFLNVLSGMTAAVRKPLGDILADEAASRYLRDMLEEMVRLARAEGIPVTDDIHSRIMGRYENAPKTMTSSMHRDLVKGMPLELENLQGYAVRVGEKHGIPVPCIRTVHALLHPYRNGAL